MENSRTLLGNVHLSAEVYTAKQLKQFAEEALQRLESGEDPHDLVDVLSAYFSNFMDSNGNS